MDDDRKRELIKRYFDPRKTPYVLIGMAVIGVLMMFADEPGSKWIGLLLIVPIIGLLVYRKMRPRPTHAQIDQWLSEDLAELPRLALAKLDLDEEDLTSDPLLVIGPVLWQTNGVPSDELLYRVEERGKVKKARYAIYHVTAILLTESHLGAYAADFNFLRHTFLNEHAQEFHYQDVVSVSLREDSTNLSLASGEKVVHGEQFRVSVSSGENINVIVKSRELRDLTGADEDTSDVENVVRAIRKMLREKKQGAAAQ